jgi:hypothetical protein
MGFNSGFKGLNNFTWFGDWASFYGYDCEHFGSVVTGKLLFRE